MQKQLFFTIALLVAVSHTTPAQADIVKPSWKVIKNSAKIIMGGLLTWHGITTELGVAQAIGAVKLLHGVAQQEGVSQQEFDAEMNANNIYQNIGCGFLWGLGS